MLAHQIDLFETSPAPCASIIEDVISFSHNGDPTVVMNRAGIDFFFNEFWTARQRQANRLHEISYRACFKPQLPEFFISRLTAPGDTVYDPFMGRGTTPLQAALMGRRAIGNDVNPLSTILTRPRLSPPRLDEIADRLARIDWEFSGVLNEALLVFFHEATLKQIHALREWFRTRAEIGDFDEIDDWIRMVAVNRLTGHSPGFFSVYTLPPNQAVSIDAQRKINRKRDQTPSKRDVASIILKKSRALLSDPHPVNLEKHILLARSAEKTPEVADGSVDLVVTSPPFLDVVQYAADNWLRCWFAHLEADVAPIAIHKNADDWTMFVRRVFCELARVVRRNGHVAFEVGEVRNGKLQLEELVVEAMIGLPFETLGVLVNVQSFTKTANCWGVANNAKGTNSNRIVLARRR